YSPSWTGYRAHPTIMCKLFNSRSLAASEVTPVATIAPSINRSFNQQLKLAFCLLVTRKSLVMQVRRKSLLLSRNLQERGL
ncbi:hypothetical protein, partial [Microcoleus sp. LEGE 07076]|uniref:hypothetical protein n=1 Tax=Microcoleus sp. LEGE 07076 TaxID=915322 RepID=UPI001D14B08A